MALAALGLSDWQAVTGRGTRERLTLSNRHAHAGEIEMIDDAYNANPASIAAALDVLASAEARRRVAVLGDMLELGQEEAQCHAQLASNNHLLTVDVVHCVGPLMRHTWEALPDAQQGQWFETAAELAHKVRSYLRAGDIVLVKGSKGSAVSQVVTAIRETMRPKTERRGND